MEDLAYVDDPDFRPSKEFVILALDDVDIYRSYTKYGCNNKKLGETSNGLLCKSCQSIYPGCAAGTFARTCVLIEDKLCASLKVDFGVAVQIVSFSAGIA